MPANFAQARSLYSGSFLMSSSLSFKLKCILRLLARMIYTCRKGIAAAEDASHLLPCTFGTMQLLIPMQFQYLRGQNTPSNSKNSSQQACKAGCRTNYTYEPRYLILELLLGLRRHAGSCGDRTGVDWLEALKCCSLP